MKENLYPVEFRGKKYYEKDCNSIFKSFYHHPMSLRFDNSVYVSEGMSIFPNGEWSND